MTGRSLLSLVLGLTLVVAAPAVSQTPKRGGVLNAMLAEDPPGFFLRELQVRRGSKLHRLLQ
jgi:hypothetical protein